MENSKQVRFVIACTVPVPSASLLGGNAANKGLSKIDRENRYFLNALLRRGAVVISQEEVVATAPVAKEVKAAAKS